MFNREDIPRGGGVYFYNCKQTDYKYVGKTKEFINRVWGEIRELRRYKGTGIYSDTISKALQDEFLKWGEDNFELSYIEVDDEEIMDVLECHYIKKYDAVFNGYNNTYRDSENILRKYKNSRSYTYNRKIRNEEENLLYNELKNILEYNSKLKELVSFYQLLNEFRAIYNRDLDSTQLFKIIKTLSWEIYLKSPINYFYYEITFEQFESLIYLNKACTNEILRGEFMNKENILENVIVSSYGFTDKLNYIDQVKIHNDDYLEYIDRWKDELEYTKNEHYRNVQRLSENYNPYYDVLKKIREIQMSIEENNERLKEAEGRIIKIPRYIIDNDGKIISNPNNIAQIDICELF